jgi:hypothetical protein
MHTKTLTLILSFPSEKITVFAHLVVYNSLRLLYKGRSAHYYLI